MRKRFYWVPCALSVLASSIGCVSSPEAKQAAVDVSKSLGEMSQANTKLMDAWSAEIDQTREQLGRAIVARMVVRAVESESGRKEQQAGTLFKVSQRIEEQQDIGRRLVGRIMRISMAVNDDPADKLKGYKVEQADSLARLAAQYEQSNRGLAKQFKDRADGLRQGAPLDDQITDNRLLVLLRLQQMKAVVRDNLVRGEANFDTLRGMHGVVRQFIETDVSASGQELGRLVTEHADLFAPTTRPATTTTRENR